MPLSRRLAPILFLPLACTAASDTSTTTSDGSTTHAEGSASTHEDPTGHASHTGSTGATTGATTGMTTGDVTTHATHDSHASHTTTDTTDTQASTSSTSTGGGDPVADYCACMLENCHDQYHATWGEDHVASEAMCIAAAEALPSVGMPATDGNSLECRDY